MEWLVRFIRVLIFRIRRFLKGPTTTISPFLRQKEFLSRHQFEEAQRVAHQTEQPFHRVLINLGFTGDRDVQMAKAQELGMAYADLDRIKIDDSVRSLVPLATLVQHHVVPVRRDDNNLWLASSDPASLTAFDEVRGITGLRIIPVLALAQDIDELIARWSAAI